MAAARRSGRTQTAARRKPSPAARPSPLGGGLGVERWQWMRSCPEQPHGNQLEIRPLTEEAFRRFVRPGMGRNAFSYDVFRAKYPDDVYYALFRAMDAGGRWGEWKPFPPITGSLAALRPDAYKAKFWARRVESFDAEDARRWGAVCDTEAYGPGVPKADDRPYALPRVPRLKREGQEAFEREGFRAGRATVLRYDGAMAALTRERAQSAADRILSDEISVMEAANEEAGHMIEAGLSYDPKDLAIELADAYWRGVARGAGEAHDRIRARGYAPKTSAPLPDSASDRTWARIKRALKN